MSKKNVLPGIQDITRQMIDVRHAIHTHPELGFEEVKTQGLIVHYLQQWGYETHQGLAKTGVVGTLRRGKGRTIGLRADMDALPITEKTGVPWASKLPGKMHACGHDGHTAMLLTAAYELSVHSDFQGTVHLFFQPSEENFNGSGAKRMLEEGVFELFPCDAIFAMHNMPGIPTGKLGFATGAFMASSDEVRILIFGRGGHGAMPHKAVDPVLVSASLVMTLQSIVSRNVSPLETAVISVGALIAGDASNVIPDTAEMRLTVRTLNPEVRQLLRERITSLVTSQVESFGAKVEIDYQERYPVLINDAVCTQIVQKVATDLVGEENVLPGHAPFTGSEDFAYWLEQCPGCYLIIGNGDGEDNCMVHNPGYDFNDEALPIGASFWVKLVEYYLSIK